MIEVRGLTRRYGSFEAVSDVSFTVGEGEILGMLGPNGAGKTTTIRMITGFLPPSAGEIRVAGHDLLRQPVLARRQIGYLPENVALYPEMRVAEFLAYRARLQGLRGAQARAQVAAHVERCLLTEVVDQIIGTLSKGFRQRVGLAAAMLHDPRVLVLDEPTVGLDPKQIIAIRELIRELGRRRTVLLSTHILPEVELLCDRVQIIDHGRIVAEGTAASLSEQWAGNRTLRVVLAGPDVTPAAAAAAIAAIAGVVGVRSAERDEREAKADELALALECEPEADVRAAIFRCVVERGWLLLGLAQSHASLEDVFVRLTRDEGREARPSPSASEDEAPPAEVAS